MPNSFPSLLSTHNYRLLSTPFELPRFVSLPHLPRPYPQPERQPLKAHVSEIQNPLFD
jgi:hypothetical protein